MIVRKIFLLLVFIGLAVVLGSSISWADSPQQRVESVVDEAILVFKDESLDWQEKKVRTRSIVLDSVDLRSMSQRILSKNWQKASDEERERFIQLFTELLETTYIDRIEDYSDERMEYVRERIKGDRAIVDTLFITKKKQIPINYKLIRKEGKWWVFDIVIEEVSLISSYRETYSEIVMRDGIEGLLTRMENKIEELKASRKGS
jgi:phospholipid transport system substrate-binding protein